MVAGGKEGGKESVKARCKKNNCTTKDLMKQVTEKGAKKLGITPSQLRAKGGEAKARKRAEHDEEMLKNGTGIELRSKQCHNIKVVERNSDGTTPSVAQYCTSCNDKHSGFVAIDEYDKWRSMPLYRCLHCDEVRALSSSKVPSMLRCHSKQCKKKMRKISSTNWKAQPRGETDESCE